MDAMMHMREWFTRAFDDLDAAGILVAHGKSLQAVYLCGQALRKGLTAWCWFRFHEPPFARNLQRLADESDLPELRTGEGERLIELLARFVEEVREPGLNTDSIIALGSETAAGIRERTAALIEGIAAKTTWAREWPPKPASWDGTDRRKP